MKYRIMLFVLAATLGALSLPPVGAELQQPGSAVPPQSEDERPEFFLPREETEKFLYNMPFYPPGKTPPGELEYDPIPFEELLPPDERARTPQPIAVPADMQP